MALSETMQIHAATDVGQKRDHNEDNYLVDRELGLCIVCDGMGGHAAGEVASSMAVRGVHAELRRFVETQRQLAEQGLRREVTTKEILRALEITVQTVSSQIHATAQQDEGKRGMGTTLSLLWVLGSNGYVAHVGDSRIYLERGGTLYQITDDHTVGKELLRLGMATPENLQRLPQGALTRAVGVHAHVQVDTMALELLPADQFLLASDGLTGYLEDPSQLVPQLGDQNGDRAVQALIAFANACGGKDNITAVLARLGSGEAADQQRARRVQLKKEVLAGMPLFSRLDERELLRVMHVAQVTECQTGDVVMREGELGEELYIVLSGQLRISTGQTFLRDLGPGNHVGEMALIRNRPRSATVTAVEPTELITIKRYDFFDIIRTEPYIAVKLLWQFLGVVSDWLERTSKDLSKANEVIHAEDITDAVLSEPTHVDAEQPGEAELDPFIQPPSIPVLDPVADTEPGLEPSPAPPPAQTPATTAEPSPAGPSGADKFVTTVPMIDANALATDDTLPHLAAPDARPTIPQQAVQEVDEGEAPTKRISIKPAPPDGSTDGDGD
ncbi:MAG: cyclic nucleotide-binding domain-containing protein [Deltaproteobacteria bacterium]|jgi:serine/threonine protein phosphatase PrpC/CRP-like cAMP-binding protein|nr:cyclic nucleotide-binding domain-containing protein [Deltaproteobacteria bacterium]MBW2537182.1 cyclic nucleotide-binding domain-containing protein [Deltaproteobacteria bacterium]